MQCSHLPEVIAGDREGDSQGEQTWMAEQRPEEEMPVLYPFHTDDAQSVNGSPESQKVLRFNGGSNHRRFILAQKSHHPCIVELWRINLA